MINFEVRVYIFYTTSIKNIPPTSFPFQVPGYKMDKDGTGSNKQYALSLENEPISI